jgi:myxalamid-type polyketide synthase MxaE and MxaD
MAGESAAIADAGMERQGIGSLTSEQGAALFAWTAGRADPFLAVLPVDWAAFTKARAGRAEPFLSQVKGAADQGALAAQLADAKGPARRAIFAKIIAETVAHTLRLPVADVDHGREFGTMGMTSLLAMEMRNRLERTLGMPLSATLAWNYPTAAALSAHLAGEENAGERQAEVATSKPATLVAAAPEVAEELAVVANLSDDDALLRLRQRRAGKVS